MAIPHLGWLQFGGITLVFFSWLTLVIHGHVAANGTLVTLGLRPSRAMLITVAAVILGLVILNSSAFSPSKTTTPTHPNAASEVGRQAVVHAFFTAINDHNWPRVWDLGGKNLGNGMYSTYNGMISGYRCTTRVVLDGSPTTSRDTVSGSIRAYEANGADKAIQRFAFRYQVSRGVIVSGHASLSGGSPPPGC